jgi:hypothetical protein
MLLSDDPNTMALLSMGAGLLQAGGPSTTPTSFGQAAGSALQSGMGAFMQAKQQKQREEQAKIQSQLAQSQLDQIARRNAFYQRFSAQQGQAADRLRMRNPDAPPTSLVGEPGQQPADLWGVLSQDMGGAMEFAPELVTAAMKPKGDRTKVIGDTLYDLDANKPIFTAPDKAVGPSSAVGKLADDLAAGRITQDQYNQEVAWRSRPGVQVNSNMPPLESEEQKQVGRYYGERFSSMQDSGIKAAGGIARLERLDQLLDQVNTGAFADNMLSLKKAAKAVGVDLDAMGVRDDVAPAEAANALANEMALELRNPAGGAGMPGAMSDKDREMLQSMTPSLTQTPEGRKLLIDARKRLYKREQQVAQRARSYRQKNGRLDEGFFDELAQWSEQNPLYSNEDMNRAEKARLPTFASPAEASAQPSGTRFVDPKGVIRVVP